MVLLPMIFRKVLGQITAVYHKFVSASPGQTGPLTCLFESPMSYLLAHLFGAYVGRSVGRSVVVHRPSCVVCVHHNYQK